MKYVRFRWVTVALAAGAVSLIALPARLAPGVLMSSVAVSKLAPSSAVISWSTMVDTTGEVEYGPTAGYGNATPSVPLDTDHRITIDGLTGMASYHFRAVSKDKNGNMLYSPDQTLTTPGTVDATLPSAITNLRVVRNDLTSVTLSWTAPGDDGQIGRASVYDLRWSAGAPLAMGEQWERNTVVQGLPEPQVAGTLQTYTVTDLQPVTTYYFAIRARDDGENWSVVSPVAEVRTDPMSNGAFEIQAINIRYVTSYSAIISWFTTMQADTQLIIGTTAGVYELPTIYDGRLAYNHSAVVSGLNPLTTYYVKILAINARRQSSQTDGFSFRTLAR